MKPEKRVKKLEQAILFHRGQILSMGLRGGPMDRVLWAVLDTKKRSTG